jgi:hypothetical protein
MIIFVVPFQVSLGLSTFWPFAFSQIVCVSSSPLWSLISPVQLVIIWLFSLVSASFSSSFLQPLLFIPQYFPNQSEHIIILLVQESHCNHLLLSLHHHFHLLINQMNSQSCPASFNCYSNSMFWNSYHFTIYSHF